MIPKIIHYCWFGRNALPPLAIKCINSWKMYLPDYEIKEWNEDNFDVNVIPYTRDAYKEKKYAFVSDYARFWILYNCGGLYFDTDVEIISSIDDIINKGPFMGCESEYKRGASPESLGVNPGLGLGSEKGMLFFKYLLDNYQNLSFYKADGTLNIETTIVAYTSNLLVQKGLKNTSDIQDCAGFKIYPKDYFCPIDYVTLKSNKTKNTRSIHHYAATWQMSPKRKFLENILGFKMVRFIDKIRRNKLC